MRGLFDTSALNRSGVEEQRFQAAKQEDRKIPPLTPIVPRRSG